MTDFSCILAKLILTFFFFFEWHFLSTTAAVQTMRRTLWLTETSAPGKGTMQMASSPGSVHVQIIMCSVECSCHVFVRCSSWQSRSCERRLHSRSHSVAIHGALAQPGLRCPGLWLLLWWPRALLIPLGMRGGMCWAHELCSCCARSSELGAPYPGKQSLERGQDRWCWWATGHGQHWVVRDWILLFLIPLFSYTCPSRLHWFLPFLFPKDSLGTLSIPGCSSYYLTVAVQAPHAVTASGCKVLWRAFPFTHCLGFHTYGHSVF